MVDFAKLLEVQIDDIKRPKPIPAGNYDGTIVKYEFLESRGEKKTPYVEFSIRLESAGEGVDESELVDVELSTKILRHPFYLTTDAMFRLRDFIETFGESTAGRSVGEMIPDLLNRSVSVEVTQSLNKKDPLAPPYSNISKIAGNV